MLGRYFDEMQDDRRAPRRHRREVHRRRGDGRLRRAAGARGRRRCGPCGPPSRCATRSRELGVEARIGLNTGEVVAGTAETPRHRRRGQRRRRLEQAAERRRDPDRRCDTLGWSRDAVEAEPIEPLDAEGQERAGRCLPAASAAGRDGAGIRPPTRCAHGRSRARARAAASDAFDQRRPKTLAASSSRSSAPPASASRA